MASSRSVAVAQLDRVLLARIGLAMSKSLLSPRPGALGNASITALSRFCLCVSMRSYRHAAVLWQRFSRGQRSSASVARMSAEPAPDQLEGTDGSEEGFSDEAGSETGDHGVADLVSPAAECAAAQADSSSHLPLMPQEGPLSVAYDALRAEWVVVNSATFEQTDIPEPEGEWEIDCNADHVAFVFDTGDDESELWSNELLNFTLYGMEKSPASQILVSKGEQVSLQAYLMEHAACAFGWKSAACQAQDVNIFVFEQTQCGWSVWLDLRSVMVVKTGFTLKATKEPNKWLYTMWPAWERYMDGLLMSPALRRSVEYSPGILEPGWWRCLASPTVHPAGAFALLGRLACAPRYGGGFRGDDNRAKARLAFFSLLAQAAVPLQARIVLSDDLAPSGVGWVSGGSRLCVVEVHVSADMMLQLGELRQQLSRTGMQDSEVWASLKSLFCEPETLPIEQMHLGDFLVDCFEAWRMLKGFLGQLFLAFGSALEKCILAHYEVAMESSKGASAGGVVRSLDSAWKRREMERHLLKYLDAARLESSQVPLCGVALDASSVAGRQTLSCLLVLPDNRCVVLPPQELRPDLSGLMDLHRPRGWAGGLQPRFEVYVSACFREVRVSLNSFRSIHSCFDLHRPRLT